MPISNREAYELKQTGRSVIVECADCGRTIWTADGTYVIGTDKWYCEDCQDELVDEVFDGD